MSLIADPDRAIKYINDAEKIVRDDKHPVFFDLSDITQLTSDAVTYLMAALDAKPLRDSGSRGSAPEYPSSMEMLVQCGFFKRVHPQFALPATTDSILRIKGERLVASSVAREMRKFATQRTLGKDQRIRALQEIAIDCMANSQEHGHPSGQTSAKWFFLVHFDKQTRVSHFTFIDRGIGILESIKDRDRGFFDRVFSSFKNNNQLLEAICKGEVKSRTNQPNRGKGLPKMYRYYVQKKIHRFIIITNDVFADFENADIHTLINPFKGTCIHWELRP
jgi:hypothetical protein